MKAIFQRLIGILIFAATLNVGTAGGPLLLTERGSWPGYQRGTLFAVRVSGHYAYLGLGLGGVRVLDISDPRNPQRVASFPTDDIIFHLTITGTQLIAYEVPQRALRVDISDPTHPQVLGTTITQDDSPRAGAYSFVASGSEGIQVIDVSDQANPRVVTNLVTVSYANDVALAGAFAYVADGAAGVTVINIIDPTHPTIARPGALDLLQNDYARSVAISRNYLLVGRENGGLHILDITNPTNPVPVTVHATAGEAAGIVVTNGIAYLADGTAGLRLLNVQNPAAPQLLSSLKTPGAAAGLSVSSNLICVAEHQAGLQVIDSSDLAAPRPLGTYAYPDVIGGPFGTTAVLPTAWDVRISGQRAYVAYGSAELRVVNLGDGTNPQEIFGSDFSYLGATGVALSSNLVYVTSEEAGLRIFDPSVITNSQPGTPTFVSALKIPDAAVGLAISGNYAYVAAWSRGLQIVDIRDPAHPFIAGSFPEASTAQRVAVSGDYAYVASAINGLTVVDISDPTAPRLAARITGIGIGHVEDVAVSGNYLYLANYNWGLRILDINSGLRISPNNGGFQISWPAATTGYRLETTTGLTNTWQDISSMVTLDDQNWQAHTNASSQAQFFRLVR